VIHSTTSGQDAVVSVVVVSDSVVVVTDIVVVGVDSVVVGLDNVVVVVEVVVVVGQQPSAGLSPTAAHRQPSASLAKTEPLPSTSHAHGSQSSAPVAAFRMKRQSLA